MAAAKPDFLLERLIHSLFYGSMEDACHLIMEVHAGGMDGFTLFTQALWPAMECTQQVRHSGLVPPRAFNHATHVLTALAARLLPAASARGAARRVFIMSAPGEPSDAAAQLLAALAQARTLSPLFAGAHLTVDDICFALPQLRADVVLVHGSIAASLDELESLLITLRERAVWPDVQLAATGAILAGRGSAHADLSAVQPDELLELLLLCPDRRQGGSTALPKASPEARENVLLEPTLMDYFPSRFRGN
jgi:hypothetical protein